MPTPTTDEFLQMVTPQTRATVAELLRQPEVSLDALRQQVADHTLEYIAEAALRRDLDPELGRAVQRGCVRLLELAAHGLPPPARAIVQAACEYYVFDDDADGDFDGLTGLDDDAEVVNAALTAFGLDADCIRIG